MKQSNFGSALLSLSVDRSDPRPLNVQLMQAIRSLILDKKLSAAGRLPASRELAQELRVSRSTITSVYDQLVSEGYLEARRGSGYFVDGNLPDYPDYGGGAAPVSSEKPATTLPTPLQPFEASSPDILLFHMKRGPSVWKGPGEAPTRI